MQIEDVIVQRSAPVPQGGIGNHRMMIILPCYAIVSARRDRITVATDESLVRPD
jgi:hypothetical protein